MKGATIAWTVSLSVFVIALVAMPVFDVILRYGVSKEVVLVNSSMLYNVWEDPAQLPVYLQVWVFNLTNPEATLKGDKPHVSEIGPFTYRERRQKFDIVHNSNGTVTYKEMQHYDFVESMSIASDSTEITTGNIPLMTLIHAVHWRNQIIRDILDGILDLLKSEKLFIKKTVREMAWGYHDAMLTDGKILFPKVFYTDFIGVLMNKNNTYDGVYTIHTGENNINNLGIINRYNGSSSLPFWTSDQANMINGTDGTLSPPFLDKNLNMQMFSTDICRSIYGIYNETITNEFKIPLHRYKAPRSALASAKENPDNTGFCTPKGNCLGSGVLNLTVCKSVDSFPLPVLASNPHFYMADDEYINAIQGMMPNPDWHASVVDIEPISGVVMHIAKRLQINLHIFSDSQIKQTGKVRTLIFPLLWINESMKIDAHHAEMVHKELLFPKYVVDNVIYCLLAASAFLLLVSVTWTSREAIVKQEEMLLSFKDDEEDSVTDANEQSSNNPVRSEQSVANQPQDYDSFPELLDGRQSDSTSEWDDKQSLVK